MLRIMLLIAAVLITLASAAAPVATVSTSGPVSINGALVPSTAATWPLAAGDEIATTTNPAVILFSDGSRITIDKQTRVRLAGASTTNLELLEGKAIYRAAAKSNFAMRALGRPVDLRSLREGVVSISPEKNVLVRQVSKDDDSILSAVKGKKPKPRSAHDKDKDDDDRGGGPK